MLNYFHANFPDFAGMPTRPQWLHVNHGDPQHHLRIQVHDIDASDIFRLDFDFNCEVFDDSGRRRTIAHFLRILNLFVEDRTRRIAHTSLVSGDEEVHLLQALKPSSVSEDTDQSLIQLFEIQVRRAPGTTAVVFQEEQLSFGELNARSNRLARLLRARGGTPGVLVGVRLQRSTELLIALLGILKAGGAYVPIDPTLPAERLISILDDTRIPLLLTHSDLQESLPEHSSKTICLDLVDETLNLQRSEDLTHRTTASDTAYVIYTSGSTGQPKGVLVPHGALANYLSWARDQYSDRPRQSYPLFTSLAFDFTITSLFVPLIAGGTIYVYPEKKEVMDSSILDVIAANEVDVVKLTPAHLGMIKDLDLKDSKVTTLILGGGKISAKIWPERPCVPSEERSESSTNTALRRRLLAA